MNTSTLDHHGHFEIPKKAIELFIMKVMAPTRLYLETNIRSPIRSVGSIEEEGI